MYFVQNASVRLSFANICVLRDVYQYGFPNSPKEEKDNLATEHMSTQWVELLMTACLNGTCAFSLICGSPHGPISPIFLTLEIIKVPIPITMQ